MPMALTVLEQIREQIDPIGDINDHVQYIHWSLRLNSRFEIRKDLYRIAKCDGAITI